MRVNLDKHQIGTIGSNNSARKMFGVLPQKLFNTKDYFKIVSPDRISFSYTCANSFFHSSIGRIAMEAIARTQERQAPTTRILGGQILR